MTKVYKRSKEEDTFECNKCHLVWRDSWVEPANRGWCPGCHVENMPCELVKLKTPNRIPMSSELAEFIRKIKIS